MEINLEDNKIKIIVNKCNNETIQIFIKEYTEFYSKLPEEKKYKLIFIQKNNIDVTGLTLLGLVLYNKFKTILKSIKTGLMLRFKL